MVNIPHIPWAGEHRQLADLLVVPVNNRSIQRLGVRLGWLTAYRFREQIDGRLVDVIKTGIQETAV